MLKASQGTASVPIPANADAAAGAGGRGESGTHKFQLVDDGHKSSVNTGEKDVRTHVDPNWLDRGTVGLFIFLPFFPCEAAGGSFKGRVAKDKIELDEIAGACKLKTCN